jgi:tetratricopeptide (TPR) repeat protein
LKPNDSNLRHLALCFGLLALVGCAAGSGQRGPGFQEQAERGDPQRRASMRLVLQGIGADESGDTRQALSRYERSLQIDSGNPYAHLALARHFIELGDTSRGLVHLDQARTMFEDAGPISPLVEAHLLGLRGAALRSEGRLRDAQPMLDHAARLAPDLWGDGQLDAGELR